MISNKQKQKLRSLLEKISTPEEMKAFDMEILAEKQDKGTSDIIDEIKKSKSEVSLDFVKGLIDKVESSLSNKISDLKEAVHSKTYPTYNDSDVKKKLDAIMGAVAKDPIIAGAEQRSKTQMIDELINIGDTLVSMRDMAGKQTTVDNKQELNTINTSLEGVGSLLLQILSKTGSNNSQRLQNAAGTIINPATDDTLQDSLANYHGSGFDPNDGDTMYRARMDKDGNWYIKKIVLSAATELYVTGIGNFDTAWTGRAGLTYQEFNLVF